VVRFKKSRQVALTVRLQMVYDRWGKSFKKKMGTLELPRSKLIIINFKSRTNHQNQFGNFSFTLLFKFKKCPSSNGLRQMG